MPARILVLFLAVWVQQALGSVDVQTIEEIILSPWSRAHPDILSQGFWQPTREIKAIIAAC